MADYPDESSVQGEHHSLVDTSSNHSGSPAWSQSSSVESLSVHLSKKSAKNEDKVEGGFDEQEIIATSDLLSNENKPFDDIQDYNNDDETLTLGHTYNPSQYLDADLKDFQRVVIWNGENEPKAIPINLNFNDINDAEQVDDYNTLDLTPHRKSSPNHYDSKNSENTKDLYASDGFQSIDVDTVDVPIFDTVNIENNVLNKKNAGTIEKSKVENLKAVSLNKKPIPLALSLLHSPNEVENKNNKSLLKRLSASSVNEKNSLIYKPLRNQNVNKKDDGLNTDIPKQVVTSKTVLINPLEEEYRKLTISQPIWGSSPMNTSPKVTNSSSIISQSISSLDILGIGSTIKNLTNTGINTISSVGESLYLTASANTEVNDSDNKNKKTSLVDSQQSNKGLLDVISFGLTNTNESNNSNINTLKNSSESKKKISGIDTDKLFGSNNNMTYEDTVREQQRRVENEINLRKDLNNSNKISFSISRDSQSSAPNKKLQQKQSSGFFNWFKKDSEVNLDAKGTENLRPLLAYEINSKNFKKIMDRTYEHISNTSNDICNDQKRLNEQINEMNEYCTKLCNTISSRQYESKIQLDSLSRFNGIREQASKCGLAFTQALLTLKKLEPLIPAEDKPENLLKADSDIGYLKLSRALQNING